jgi:hypothetical protein
VRVALVALPFAYWLGQQALALDCHVVMAKNDGVKRFFSQVLEDADDPRVEEAFDALSWLQAWRAEQRLNNTDIEILKGCLARTSEVRATACEQSLDQVSQDLYLMNQDLKDAQACEFGKLPPTQRRSIEALIVRSEMFHTQMLKAFHNLDWRRAMQRAN